MRRSMPHVHQIGLLDIRRRSMVPRELSSRPCCTGIESFFLHQGDRVIIHIFWRVAGLTLALVVALTTGNSRRLAAQEIKLKLPHFAPTAHNHHLLGALMDELGNPSVTGGTS